MAAMGAAAEVAPEAVAMEMATVLATLAVVATAKVPIRGALLLKGYNHTLVGKRLVERNLTYMTNLENYIWICWWRRAVIVNWRSLA
uniref:Putative secreted protein n=1 Tax=Anopheles marajoara TaxID=58244 RepID=A0A2M4CAJ5_9DIPT